MQHGICDLTAINDCAIKNKLTIRKPYDDRDSQIDLNAFRPALGAQREQVRAGYAPAPVSRDLPGSFCLLSPGWLLAGPKGLLAA